MADDDAGQYPHVTSQRPAYSHSGHMYPQYPADARIEHEYPTDVVAVSSSSMHGAGVGTGVGQYPHETSHIPAYEQSGHMYPQYPAEDRIEHEYPTDVVAVSSSSTHGAGVGTGVGQYPHDTSHIPAYEQSGHMYPQYPADARTEHEYPTDVVAVSSSSAHVDSAAVGVAIGIDSAPTLGAMVGFAATQYPHAASHNPAKLQFVQR